jgi:hypothetical protein
MKKFHKKYIFVVLSLAAKISSSLWGVSSVPFHFGFPFQLHCELVSSGISSKYFDMACYLKQETFSGPISFEVQ